MKVIVKMLPSTSIRGIIVKTFFDVDDGTKGYLLDSFITEDTPQFFFRHQIERDLRRAVIDIADGKVVGKARTR